MDSTFTLLALGWQPYFQQQLSLDDLESNQIARISSCHTTHYELASEAGITTLADHGELPDMMVGDWVITDAQGDFIRQLDRSSSFDGIAANIDTVFIIAALDKNFSLPLIQRYLTLTHEAKTDAVVILTKADNCSDVSDKRAQVERLDPLLLVETVNALDSSSLACLSPVLKAGKTIALLGATGAGKSALITSLMNDNSDTPSTKIGSTGTLQTLPQGALLLDSTELRELQVAQYNNTAIESYADILALAETCRFSDCSHQGEPGCAIAKAVNEKRLDEERVANFMLMLSEDDDSTTNRSKPQAKFYRSAQSDVRARKHSAAD